MTRTNDELLAKCHHDCIVKSDTIVEYAAP